VHYHRRIEARTSGGGKTWAPTIARPTYLSTAQGRRIVLVTGSGDFNRPQITDVFAAMQQDAFARVRLLDVPGLGHALPDVQTVDAALSFLDPR
jgi:hypothetical protein